MTRWSPDTCGCEIEYNDNIEVVAVVRKCAKHADTPDAKGHFELVLTHNRRKNVAHNAVVEHLRKTKPDVKHEDVLVVYDDNDDLHVLGSGLSVAEQQDVIGGLELGRAALKFSN